MRQLFATLISLFLHGGIVASALIYFPSVSRLTEDMVVVPIELVTLSDATNVRAQTPQEVEPEPDPVEPEAARPDVEAAPEPEPVAAEPEIIPPAPEDIPEPELEPEPAEPEPEPEPEPETRQPERPAGLDLNAVRGALNEGRAARNQNRGEVGQANQSAGAGTADTATLQALFVSQIQACVRSNLDAPRNMDLRVLMEVRLERDGSLASVRLRNQDQILNSSNRFLRVAGERALRAASECAPYDMPAQHYQQWRLLEVNVDTQR